MTTLLHCDDLVVGYGAKRLLPPMQVEIGSGEFWSLVGRNGSGKSTWFKTVLGFQPAVSGHCAFSRRDLPVSYLSQRTDFDDLYPVRVSDVVAMAQERGWSFLLRGRSDRAVTEDALREMGISDLAPRPFRSLSQGQKQRVLLARLLAARAEIAFLDEPTAAMDAVAEREAFLMLDRLRRKHSMTIVIVTHYLKVARDFADHALFFDRESSVVLSGLVGDVFADPTFQRRYSDPAEARSG